MRDSGRRTRRQQDDCRGLLVGDGASEEQRRAFADELEATIKERRRNEWDPE